MGSDNRITTKPGVIVPSVVGAPLQFDRVTIFAAPDSVCIKLPTPSSNQMVWAWAVVIVGCLV
jgi:hypothetical protein